MKDKTHAYIIKDGCIFISWGVLAAEFKRIGEATVGYPCTSRNCPIQNFIKKYEPSLETIGTTDMVMGRDTNGAKIRISNPPLLQALIREFDAQPVNKPISGNRALDILRIVLGAAGEKVTW